MKKSQLKNVLLMGLSLALVAAIAVFGTVAYLTDTDEDVNVMTLGNVKIEQHEYERATNADGSYKTDTIDNQTSYVLQDFTQAKPLLPVVGDPDGGYDPTEVRLAQLGHNSRGVMSVLNVANAQDKFVVVENTGKTDAYVRTIVAFEAGSLDETEWDAVVNYSFHFTWEETQNWFVVEIGGNNYYLVEFVYNGYEDVQHPNGVLKPGDYTYNSLAQVYMKSTATNEVMEKIDGNKNGTFDILVLSQAVQADGFTNAKTALDTGFGAFNEENAAEWFSGKEFVIPTVVSTTEELVKAIENAKDGDAIYMTAGTYETALNLQGKSLTIQGAGTDKTFIVGPEDYTTQNIPMQSWAGWGGADSADSNVYALISANEDVTIKNLTVKADPEQIGEVAEFRHETAYAFVGIHVQSANAVIENVNIKGIKPDTVNGNDHHNFGLYITTAVNDANTYTATYKNGIVSDVNRGGIYCWSGNYTLNFEDVTVIGPGNSTNPNGTLTPDSNNSDVRIYAFAPFYVCSPATYKNVEIRDSYRVEWGGASWNWSASWTTTNLPAGVTCINCGNA